MSSNIIQAINKLSDSKEQLKPAQPIIDQLKDALKLAGKTNQQINMHRRESFKPSLPNDLKKLVEKPPSESTWLFGDNLKERLALVRGDNTVREAFEKKEYRYQKTPKGNRYTPYVYDKKKSSNFKTPSKTRGGSSSQGYRGMGKDKKQKPSNYRQHYNHNQMQSKNKMNNRKEQ